MSKPLFISLLFLCNLITSNVQAQNALVSGKVVDISDKEAVEGVIISIQSTTDSSIKINTASESDGSFKLENVAFGNYQLATQYLGFKKLIQNLSITNTDYKLGTLSLVHDDMALKTLIVEGIQIRSEQNGDTSSFNANAFKTNPDATAEDLLTKMPGITNTGGTLKVNGEEVKKILVDGKPFFGDDPNAAIKNLPSEIIEKIQVFDKASDQSQFTGFDDGNSEKTINILTKPGRNNGIFGKVSGAYGIDEQSQDGRYALGGNLNFFNGDRRISLVGLANNVNQQNFSSDDLLGVSASSSTAGGRGRGRGAANSTDNFLVNQQEGITQTQSGGINFSDVWGKKLKVSGSYFFNRADNNTESNISRNYILQNQDSSLRYDEKSKDKSVNLNHRVSTRLEWDIDTNNSFILNPKFSFQQNDKSKTLSGSNFYNEIVNGSSLVNNTAAFSEGYNFSNTALFRHKFSKQGRSLSINIDARINNKNNKGSLYSLNDYIDSSVLNDQIYNSSNIGTSIGTSVNYTEPLGKNSQLQFRYNPSWSSNESEKSTYNSDGTGNYNNLDSNFSNQFVNNYQYQKGGLGFRFSNKKIRFKSSIDAQYASLSGAQLFPQSLAIPRNFSSILPNAMFNYKFSRNENLRIFYRTRTNEPNINQLQNLVDNSNPLQKTVGNPNLSQEYSHSLNARYGKSNTTKGTGLFFFANASLTNNYIGNSTNIQNDGVQISMPVNLNGMFRGSAFATYSLPLKKVKSNLNLSSNLAYSNTPSLINSLRNTSKNYTFGLGAVLGSNISENIDFTLSINSNYNVAQNSAQAQSNFNYYSQNASAKFNWIFLERFVFNTNINHTMYSGLGANFNQNFVLWNASLGYKFLKNKALQADIYAFDILNQNNSISRTINDYYIEDKQTSVLQRFFMFRLTYSFRHFASGSKMPEQPEENPMRHGPDAKRSNMN